MKRLLALFLSLVLILGAVVPAYATGDGNFDGGGGGMGSGTSTNYWNPGMDGVRRGECGQPCCRGKYR